MAFSPASAPKEIWIDLDNTPHIPFFAPIIRELLRRGYRTNLTARDAYQTRELADLFRFKYTPVGHHYGRRRLLKVLGTCIRALQLVWHMRKSRASLAVSHGSRSQILAAALLRIPSLQMTDYEGAHPPILARPTWNMMPEVIPVAAGQECRSLQYPGIKEDVYVPDFVPDPLILNELGFPDDAVIATVRPPASEAHYHNPASDHLLEAVITLLSANPAIRMVLLPRNDRQSQQLRAQWPDLFSSGKAVIPDHALAGLNLIWYSDLVISGGGTMNREAAALGVPVYSIFRGPIGAVDRYLASVGRLVLLESEQDVREKIILRRRERPSRVQDLTDVTLHAVVDQIVSLVEYQVPARTGASSPASLGV